jgi:hypothetical protein
MPEGRARRTFFHLSSANGMRRKVNKGRVSERTKIGVSNGERQSRSSFNTTPIDQDAALDGVCDLFREVGVSLGDAAVGANISHFMGQPSLNNSQKC